MIEQWKNVTGFVGRYQVSNFGRVRSLDMFINGRVRHGRILTNRNRPDGYQDVLLSYNGKQYRPKVHRLVAQAFVANPDGLEEINHKDEDKTNNAVENLEWCTRKYNNAYRGLLSRRAPSVSIQVKALFNDKQKEFPSVKRAAKYFGISPSGIYDCLNNKQKTTHGMRFQRA